MEPHGDVTEAVWCPTKTTSLRLTYDTAGRATSVLAPSSFSVHDGKEPWNQFQYNTGTDVAHAETAIVQAAVSRRRRTQPPAVQPPALQSDVAPQHQINLLHRLQSGRRPEKPKVWSTQSSTVPQARMFKAIHNMPFMCQY